MSFVLKLYSHQHSWIALKTAMICHISKRQRKPSFWVLLESISQSNPGKRCPVDELSTISLKITQFLFPLPFPHSTVPTLSRAQSCRSSIVLKQISNIFDTTMVKMRSWNVNKAYGSAGKPRTIFSLSEKWCNNGKWRVTQNFLRF